jgi:HlyD family secretion protein/macrolide-specific efflux system membrane fusion protein
MDGDAVISLRKVENALTIPIESLHQENDQIYVFVKENNNTNMSKKYVKTGIETDAFVEILEGLSENDQIVISK